MSKLEFLEVNRDFRSYYRTLRDVNYYYSNSELGKEHIETTTQVITKLIFDFIRTDGITFREMNPEKYDKEYQMFQEDFLEIIENSGVNNVDFEEFASLLDELIEIANHRFSALQKIKTTRQEMKFSVEDADIQENETDIETDQSNQLLITKPQELGGSDVTQNVTIKSATEETILNPLSDEEIDDDDESKSETFESDDLFHYRPKRRRFR